MNLTTTYLGMKLRTPLVPSASPLTEDLDDIRRLEDAGASAIVFHSLFEEQIRTGRNPHRSEGEKDDLARIAASSPRPESEVTLEGYLAGIAKAKEAVSIPIIGSLNGSTFGGWTSFAKEIVRAGADALELNLYSVQTNPELTSEEIETDYLTIVASIRGQVEVPIAVKLSPYFTNLARFARRLDETGANGLVLFNRFYQPDIELETREVTPNITLSNPSTMRLPLRWIAILRGRIGASLAGTSGIHSAIDVLKMVMAGADVTMLCSALLAHGIEHLTMVEQGIREWMEEHECESLEQIKGCLSQENCPDPAAFERAQYMHGLKTASQGRD